MEIGIEASKLTIQRPLDYHKCLACHMSCTNRMEYAHSILENYPEPRSGLSMLG